MSITESVKASANEGTDAADRMPEITPAMIAAGKVALVDVGADVDASKDAILLKAIFSAMWKARKATV